MSRPDVNAAVIGLARQCAARLRLAADGVDIIAYGVAGHEPAYTKNRPQILREIYTLLSRLNRDIVLVLVSQGLPLPDPPPDTAPQSSHRTYPTKAN